MTSEAGVGPNTTSLLARGRMVEDMITRRGTLVLYAGFYLALISTALRGLDYYFLEKESINGISIWADGHENRWLVLALIAAFSTLAVLRHWRPSGIGEFPHFYLAIQSALIFPLLLLPPGQDYFAIFFFLLSLQAMLFFPPLVGFVWIGVFTVLTGAGFLIENEFRSALTVLGVYTAGYYFFGSFAAATAQAERTRHETQAALADLSQRESQLAETTRTLETLIEASPLAIIVLDREANILMRNSAAEAILGWSDRETIGGQPRAIPQEMREEFDETIARLRKGETTEVVETQRHHKDGSLVDVSIWTAALHDAAGDVTGIVAFIADVSQRKQNELALRQSEERYRVLVEGSPDAVIVFDRNGDIVDVNGSACASCGYSRHEMIGRSLQGIYQEYEQDKIEALGEHFESPLDDSHFHLEEVTLRRKDGSTFKAEAHLAAINLDGAQHFLAIVRDVSERKAAEETLLAQTRDLAVLEERNRMAREIHDTLAQGFTGVVIQLEAAEQASGDATAPIGQHLATAKALARASLQEARRSVWNLTPQALSGGSLESALEAEAKRIKPNGKPSTLTVSGQRWPLPAEVEAALLRVCQESLTNVLRHSGAETVSVDLSFGSDAVSLTVRDDGTGFDPQMLREAQGLGLRGMRERTKLLGGSLDVSSELGAGTTIKATLPKRPVESTQP